MKMLMLLILLVSNAFAAQIIPRLAWTVETSETRDRRLDLVYGETIDLECRFLSYQQPIDITGATVVLHAATNGMPEGMSFQVAGTASSNGVARIRTPVDAWIPQGLSNALWTIEVVQTNSVRILRSKGTVWLSGSSAASSNSAVSVSVWTNMLTIVNAGIVAATGEIYRVMLPSAATNGWQVSQHAAWITNETDAAALAALATNRVTRLQTADGRGWLDATGTLWSVYGIDSNSLIIVSSDVDSAYQAEVGSEWIWNPYDVPAYYYVIGGGYDEIVVGQVYYSAPRWYCQLNNNDQPILVGGASPEGTYTGSVGTVVFQYAHISGNTITSVVDRVSFDSAKPTLTNGLLSQSSADTRYLQPGATSGLIRAAHVLPIVATNVWTAMTWGAAGTNAHYEITWDASNGTFAVQEVLP